MKILIFFLVLAFLIYFFSYKRLYKKHSIKQSKKAAKIDMKDWVKWYRELPATYSPAVVSLLCNYRQELHKDLPGVILYLCVNGYIDIIDNGNEILFQDKNKDISNLMYHEKYVLYYILNKLDKFDNKLFQDYIMHDAQKLGLISDKKTSNYKGMGGMEIWRENFKHIDKYTIVLFPIIGFLFGFLKSFTSFANSSNTFTYVASTFWGFVGVFGFLVLYALLIRNILGIIMIRAAAKDKVKSEFDYLRTEKGSLDYKNWLSFKQFLEDFSMIDVRDFNEIYLWEYYLAYATSLGIADKIIKTADVRILNNTKFKILNYDKFIASIGKHKGAF